MAPTPEQQQAALTGFGVSESLAAHYATTGDMSIATTLGGSRGAMPFLHMMQRPALEGTVDRAAQLAFLMRAADALGGVVVPKPEEGEGVA